jgi:hypothetical protein
MRCRPSAETKDRKDVVMRRDKRTDGSKYIPSPKGVKGALEQASDSDLLNEAFRRRLIVEAQQEPGPGFGDGVASERRMRRWETLRRKRLREHHQRCLQERREQQETSNIDEAIASVGANTAKQLEYVGALFDLLRQKRIERMRDLGIQREDTAPEFALLGSRMTKVIFDHLVVTQRDALDAGTCDIEALWEYFMDDAGARFAEGMVKGDIGIPPDLWVSFIYTVIQGAAISFLDIAEEDLEGMASEGNESGDKKPGFIN